MLRLIQSASLMVAALLASVAVPAQVRPLSGQVGISPPFQIVAVDAAARTHSYRFQNMGSEPVQVQLSVVNWSMDEAGEMVELPTSEQSLDQWLVVNPISLAVPAGESRAVRFSIRPAVPLPPGEHRAAVIFQQVAHPDEAQPEAAGGLLFRTRFRLSSAIYATVGEVTRRGQVNDVALSSTAITLRVEATGSGHVRPQGSWQVFEQPRAAAAGADAAAALHSGELVGVAVLPGLQRSIQLPLDPPLLPGRYVVRLTGTLGDATIDETRPFLLKEQ